MPSKPDALWMGIDTSAYTTSLALVLDNGEILNLKEILKVKPGQRGLRQSEAFFQHVGNLPVLFERAGERAGLSDLQGIGVSKTPRRVEGSYMPVFEAGRSFARTLSTVTGIPLLETSHQENHVEAAAHGAGLKIEDMADGFLAVHFSGGTSEILSAKVTPTGYDLDIAAKSLDLNAGQLLDRIGVGFGFAFPAGAELEKLAAKATKKTLSIPTRLKGADFHFSGQENYAKRLIEDGEAREEVANALFRMVGKTLTRSISRIPTEAEVPTVLFSGGVMSSTLLRDYLRDRLGDGRFTKLYFAPAELASDNAVGNALLAQRYYGGVNGS